MMRLGMRSHSGWRAALSAVLAASVWAGCGGPQTVDGYDAESLRPQRANFAASPESDADLNAATRPVDEAEALALSARAPRPAQQPSDAGALERATEHGRMDESQRRATYNYFMRKGRELLQMGRPEGAIRHFEEAVQIMPGDEQAQLMLGQARMVIGREGGSAFGDLQVAQNLERSQLSEALAQIRLKAAEGKQLFDERRYREAERRFQEALDITRWLRGRIDTSAEEMRLRALLGEAQEFARVQQQQDREQSELMVQQIAEVEKQGQIQRWREEINSLYEMAQMQFERGDFDECIITLNKILWQDPYNEAVMQLREYCRNLKYQRHSERTKREMAYRWQLTLAEIHEAAVPYIGTMFEAELPAAERWREIELRSLRVLERQVTREDPEIVRLREQLRQSTVTMRYGGIMLPEVIRNLMDQGSVNITLTDAVATLPQEDLRVSIVDGVTLRLSDALDYLTELLDLGWYIAHGAVVIGTRDDAAGQGLISRIYNVADLLGGFRNFPGDRIRLDRREPDWGDPVDEGPDQSLELWDLVDLIEAVVEPGTWGDEGVRIQEDEGLRTIFVVHRPEVLNEIAQLLDDLRQSRGLMVTIEVRFVEVHDNFLEEIGIDYRGGGGVPVGAVGPNMTAAPLDEFQFGLQFTQVGGSTLTIGRDNSAGIYWANAPDSEVRTRVEHMFDQAIGDPEILTRMGGATFQFAFLDEVQLNAILRAVKKRERVNLVTAPKLTCFNTQRANITVRNQVAYIEDFVPVANQGVTIADPQVNNVEDGLVLEVQPVISANRRFITVEVQPTIALLRRPMQTLTTTLGVSGSAPVTIQLPEITIQRIRTTVTVPDGGSFLIGGVRRLADVSQTAGIPLLSDIPILGNLFTRRGYSRLRSDLVIIVKARITDLREMVDYVSPSSIRDGVSNR